MVCGWTFFLPFKAEFFFSRSLFREVFKTNVRSILTSKTFLFYRNCSRPLRCWAVGIAPLRWGCWSVFGRWGPVSEGRLACLLCLPWDSCPPVGLETRPNRDSKKSSTCPHRGMLGPCLTQRWENTPWGSQLNPLGGKVFGREANWPGDKAELPQPCFPEGPGAFLEPIDSFAEDLEMNRGPLSRGLKPPLAEVAGGQGGLFLGGGWATLVLGRMGRIWPPGWSRCPGARGP